MKVRLLLLHVALPILVGGLIYVCWRDPGLLMFKWFRALGLEPLVIQLRMMCLSTKTALPLWFIYSLPDGLWVYALTAFMALVWSGSRSSILKIACLMTGLVLGAGSELGQLAHMVPGSFDWTDFLFYLAAGVLAFLVVSRSNHPPATAGDTDKTRSIHEQPNEENFTFANRPGSLSAAGLRQRILDKQE